MLIKILVWLCYGAESKGFVDVISELEAMHSSNLRRETELLENRCWFTTHCRNQWPPNSSTTPH